MPRRLGRIIGRAIDQRPEHRYESADELAVALGRLAPRASVIPLKYALLAAVLLVVISVVLAEGPLRRYRAARSSHATFAQTLAVATRSNGPTIVVLPLKNLSAEPGSDDFVDGFTEEIINNLAISGHLQVRSRASSFAFKTKPHNLADVARRLDVSLVIEGSVRRSGQRFQVDARLVQASSGVTLWNDSVRSRRGRCVRRPRSHHSRHCQHTWSDAGAGAASLRGQRAGLRTLPDRASAREPPWRASRPKSHRLPSAGHRNGPDICAGIRRTRGCLCVHVTSDVSGMPVSKAQGLMRTAALKALELDPDLAEAHAAMGVVYARDLDWASFASAISSRPSR